jgi:NAD(P)H dehydrogenase (quinone)
VADPAASRFFARMRITGLSPDGNVMKSRPPDCRCEGRGGRVAFREARSSVRPPASPLRIGVAIVTNVAVIYYSSTGHVHALAEAAAVAAEKAGAEVRLRRVAETASQASIATTPGWAEHVAATGDVAEATLSDLDWADVILFGTPTRFGLPAAQLKQFIDSTGELWNRGRLVNKVVSSFTSTSTTHGGLESTLLALNYTFYHWGAIIVAPGYADPVQFATGNGNPYGTSHVSHDTTTPPGDEKLGAIEFQARRAVEIATALKVGLQAA